MGTSLLFFLNILKYETYVTWVRHMQKNELSCDENIISIKAGETGKAKDSSAPQCNPRK
jgi:hypothetical protein